SRSSSVLHPCYASLACFFFNAPAPTSTYTLSLHDALPISIFRVAGTYRLVLSAPLSSGWSVSRPVGCNGLPGDRHAMGAWSGTTDGRRRHHTVAQSVRGGSDGAQLSWMDRSEERRVGKECGRREVR